MKPAEKSSSTRSSGSQPDLAALHRFLREALSMPDGGGLQISKQGPGHAAEALPLSRNDATLLLELTSAALVAGPNTAVESDRDITTTRAAEILGMSRQQLVNLLKQDVLPYHLVGTHRRVRLSDVLAYKTLRSSRRRRALGELTAMSEESGLYDIDASAILDAAAKR